MWPNATVQPLQFQSALPLRGATSHIASRAGCLLYFNPRSPCGERRRHDARVLQGPRISIRAPLAGSDTGWRRSCPGAPNFNPRSPCGERLHTADTSQEHVPISIRAPLAGSDKGLSSSQRTPWISIRAPLAGSDPLTDASTFDIGNFNPRSPCGERR